MALAQALGGLLLAAVAPDSLMHNLRVGPGYFSSGCAEDIMPEAAWRLAILWLPVATIMLTGIDKPFNLV